MSNSKIFIQIASYRDPQLVPTLKDMIANAKKPKNLVFSIARQFSETDGFDNLDEFREDKRFKILDIPYQESRGVCWARNLTQQLYDGEGYTMQIDSHMRFVKDWDEILIKMIKGLQKDGYEKPLLMGVRTDGNGLGSNTDEIKAALYVFTKQVIEPFQRIITDAVEQILAFNGVPSLQ